MAEPPEVFLIAGPTASGKSALALRLAEAIGAEIVGADALQLKSVKIVREYNAIFDTH